jgi:hypothetical protein
MIGIVQATRMPGFGTGDRLSFGLVTVAVPADDGAVARGRRSGILSRPPPRPLADRLADPARGEFLPGRDARPSRHGIGLLPKHGRVAGGGVMTVVLHGSWHSPATCRVRIALDPAGRPAARTGR